MHKCKLSSALYVIVDAQSFEIELPSLMKHLLAYAIILDAIHFKKAAPMFFCVGYGFCAGIINISFLVQVCARVLTHIYGTRR